MKRKKKKWSKPQLCILVRGKIEENVLAACKIHPWGTPTAAAPNAPNGKCTNAGCGICSAQTIS